MEKRILGKSGLEVSAIGLGCMGMTHGFGARSDEKEMIKVIRGAYQKRELKPLEKLMQSAWLP